MLKKIAQSENIVKKLKLCLVLAFPLEDSHDHDDFITHFPIRINNLLKEHAEVYLICGGRIKTEKINENNIQCLKIPELKNSMLYRYLFPILLFIYTIKYQRKFNFDLFMNIVNHHRMYPVAAAARIYGKKTIARVGRELIIKKPKTVFQYKKYLKKRFLEKISLSCVDKIICVSEALKNNIASRNGYLKKISILTLGIDTKKFKKTRNENIDRILYIGRIAPVKGLEYAIEAFQCMKNEEQDIKFDIFGNGKLFDHFTEKYKDVPDLYFHGHIKHEKIPGILQEGGILVLPSFSEGFPNVLLEAMSSGVPVITTDVGDSKIFLDNGKNGIIIPKGDSGALKNAIVKMRSDQAYRNNCIDNAYKYIQKNQSFETVEEKYLNFFNNLLTDN